MPLQFNVPLVTLTSEASKVVLIVSVNPPHGIFCKFFIVNILGVDPVTDHMGTYDVRDAGFRLPEQSSYKGSGVV